MYEENGVLHKDEKSNLHEVRGGVRHSVLFDQTYDGKAKKLRKGGVYILVNEHFEYFFNAVSTVSTSDTQLSLPWHCLYFFPDPHGQGSLRPTLRSPRM